MSEEKQTDQKDNQVNEPLVFNIGDNVAGYKIVEKIDEGGFGQVFKVSMEDKIYAMKIESNMQEGGSAIKLEIDVLKDLKIRKVSNFPMVVKAGKKIKYHFLIMELLGENLRALRYRSPNPGTLTTGTWCRIGIQCLYAIKLLHDNGFLHRDIKPSNFALGPSDDLLKARLVYLFDFGLSRRFVLKGKEIRKSMMKNVEPDVTFCNPSEYKWRVARAHTEFRGTQMYASPNAHELKELGRADDVWSLMFMLAEFLAPLPWATEEKDLEGVKKSAKLSDMFKEESMAKVDENLRSCGYYTAPDYDLIYSTMKNLMDKSGTNWTDPYDWETKETAEYLKWKEEKISRKMVYMWEDPKDYFKKDNWENLAKPLVKQKMKKDPSIEIVDNNTDRKKFKKRKDDDTKDFTKDLTKDFTVNLDEVRSPDVKSHDVKSHEVKSHEVKSHEVKSHDVKRSQRKQVPASFMEKVMDKNIEKQEKKQPSIMNDVDESPAGSTPIPGSTPIAVTPRTTNKKKCSKKVKGNKIASSDRRISKMVKSLFKKEGKD